MALADDASRPLVSLIAVALVHELLRGVDAEGALVAMGIAPPLEMRWLTVLLWVLAKLVLADLRLEHLLADRYRKFAIGVQQLPLVVFCECCAKLV